MRRILLLFAITGAVAIPLNRAGANPLDEDKPHARVCLSLFEPGTPDKEEPFRSSAAPGPAKTVRAYVDSSTKCTVLIAALTKDGKLANGWRPQLSEVPEDFEDVRLPKAPVTWNWQTASGPFDFYVLFLPPSSKDLAELTKLVAAIQAPKANEHLLALQTNKLREIIGRITSDKEKTNHASLAEPEVGGLFRGSEFPWRQFAQSINFADDRPGVLILSAATAPTSAPSTAP